MCPDCVASLPPRIKAMQCPHCTDSIHVSWAKTALGADDEHGYSLKKAICPSCGRVILALRTTDRGAVAGGGGRTVELPGTEREVFVHPRGPSRAPLHESVPGELARDYREACIVLADSPKASAALSRRCLQHLLREEAKVKHSNLSNEIDEAMPGLPSHLAGAIDAVRNIGNFAAHPIKSERTGEVVDVEPGEAEWNLDTLEGLFDHYFTQPTLLQEKREALNAKLADAGKPALK